MLRILRDGADDTLRPDAAHHLLPDELMVRDGGGHPDDAHVGVAAALFARLTARQRLVSVWMTAGFSNQEIAQHLGVTQQQLAAELGELARTLRRTDNIGT